MAERTWTLQVLDDYQDIYQVIGFVADGGFDLTPASTFALAPDSVACLGERYAQAPPKLIAIFNYPSPTTTATEWTIALRPPRDQRCAWHFR